MAGIYELKQSGIYSLKAFNPTCVVLRPLILIAAERRSKRRIFLLIYVLASSFDVFLLFLFVNWACMRLVDGTTGRGRWWKGQHTKWTGRQHRHSSRLHCT
jgi:hypothetical protein